MGKLTLLFPLLIMILLPSAASALEFRPATVQSMDVNIIMEGRGAFSGTVTRGDEMNVLFLSVQEYENQQVLWVEEFMEIGGERLRPSYVTRNGLRYASYKIPDLLRYAQANEFIVVRKIRVKSTAFIGLGNDYNLATPISGFDEYKNPTDYIESDDGELVSKAMLEFRSDSQAETIRQISEWVNQNVRYDFENYYNGTYSAKHTYDVRAGVCDEFANLTAAFTRIKGIPTRYVSGVSFDGTRFGSHGWVEAYLPGTGWIGIDSTYGEAGYVDAAHFALAKTTDANRAADLIITTTSRKPLEVESRLELPDVQINSASFFRNLLEAKIIKPDSVVAGEEFKVRAIIKNNSNEDVMLPIALVAHEDFMQIGSRDRIVLFAGGESREVAWKLRAPEKGTDNAYYTYGMLLLMPDGNLADTIRLVPGDEPQGATGTLTVKDVSPFISDNLLELRVTLQNSGPKSALARISASFEGIALFEKETTIEPFSEKVFVQRIDNLQPGNLLLKVNTTQEQAFEINIPKRQERTITGQQGNTDLPGPKIPDPLAATGSWQNAQSGMISILLIVLGAFAALAAGAGILLYVMLAKKS